MAAFAYVNAGTQAAVFSRAAAAKGYFATYQRTLVPVGGVATQRIEGGSQMYKKNTSAKFAFKAVDSAGLAVTGLTITAKTGKDGVAPTTASNAVVESGSGWYYITLTATEMNGDLIVLDLSASGATIAPITISTESDYTATRASYLDAAVSGRMATYTQPTGFLAATFPATVASTTNITAATGVTVSTNSDKTGYALTSAYDPAKTAAQAGDAMALTSGERTTLAASIWNALTSGMTTVGSIGKKLADWVIGTTQTGDSYAIVNSGTYGNAAIKTAVDGVSVATNAGDMATKQADSATLTTGSTISGTYASTATNDSVYWITAPVTPAVGGFGLRQQLVFDLPLGRTPVGIQVRGYFNGSSNAVDVYALNSRTSVFDKLTNSNTNLASRNSDALYSIPLPRDYADDSGGSYNIVTLEFRATSTNTAHRLRVDQALIAHVAEDVAVTSTAPTAEQIWSYVQRELTTPGAEPVTVPTAAENATAVRTELTTELGRIDVANSTRLASADYTAPDNSSITAIKAKTDNLPSDPADASDIAGAFSTVNSTLATIAAYSDTEIAAIKAKTDLIPASPAAVSDIPSAAAIANQVLGSAVEGSVTVVQSLRLKNAALGGKASGLETATAVYRDLGDTKDRIVAAVDADGNRSAVTLDLS